MSNILTHNGKDVLVELDVRHLVIGRGHSQVLADDFGLTSHRERLGTCEIICATVMFLDRIREDLSANATNVERRNERLNKVSRERFTIHTSRFDGFKVLDDVGHEEVGSQKGEFESRINDQFFRLPVLSEHTVLGRKKRELDVRYFKNINGAVESYRKLQREWLLLQKA